MQLYAEITKRINPQGHEDILWMPIDDAMMIRLAAMRAHGFDVQIERDNSECMVVFICDVLMQRDLFVSLKPVKTWDDVMSGVFEAINRYAVTALLATRERYVDEAQHSA